MSSAVRKLWWMIPASTWVVPMFVAGAARQEASLPGGPFLRIDEAGNDAVSPQMHAICSILLEHQASRPPFRVYLCLVRLIRNLLIRHIVRLVCVAPAARYFSFVEKKKKKKEN